MALPYENQAIKQVIEESKEPEESQTDWWYFGLFVVNIVALVVSLVALIIVALNGCLNLWSGDPMDYYPEAPGLVKKSSRKSGSSSSESEKESRKKSRASSSSESERDGRERSRSLSLPAERPSEKLADEAESVGNALADNNDVFSEDSE